MMPSIDNYIYILGNRYRVKKMRGKGKGGYSFLIEDDEKREYTLKCFHHERVDYYTFSSSKVDLELDAYCFLHKNGVPIPRLLYWDRDREIILKEYIPGDTALYRITEKEDLSYLFPRLYKLQNAMKEKGVNLDWYPSNFVEHKDTLYYIDYEISPYEEKWSFENWGVGYWK